MIGERQKGKCKYAHLILSTHFNWLQFAKLPKTNYSSNLIEFNRLWMAKLCATKRTRLLFFASYSICFIIEPEKKYVMFNNWYWRKKRLFWPMQNHFVVKSFRVEKRKPLFFSDQKFVIFFSSVSLSLRFVHHLHALGILFCCCCQEDPSLLK